MGAATMWILSYCFAVLLALGACDPGPNNPSKRSIYSAAVKGGYDAGSYSSQTGSSGVLMTVEKTGSDSSTSQLQGSGVDLTGSGSLVYGTVGNAVNIGITGNDASPSTNVQGSEVLSSSVLMPLQQSSSIPKPMLLTAQVQTVPHSNSQQPASSGTIALSSPLQLSLSSGQQLPQSAVHAGRRPHKPLRGKPHLSGSRPIPNPAFNTLKPLKPKEPASHPSLQILQYGSVPSGLSVSSYELVSQSNGQTVNQPSGVQPPHVDISVVQPSNQLIQPAVDTSVAQASSQQLVQTSQSISQSDDQQPVHGRFVSMAQPSGLTLLKPQKGRHKFASQLPSSTSMLQAPGSSFVVQSTSQIPVQLRYQSEAQSASQKPGQTSYLSVPQTVFQPAQIHYQSVAQPTVQQAEASYQLLSLSNGKQLVQAESQSEAQPGPISYQFVAKPGLQQPAHVSFSVTQPISQQAGLSTYEYVVEQSGQPLFKPVQSHAVHQIGSKLYSCQELPQHGYQSRFRSPHRTSLPALTLHTKPVVQFGHQAPVKPNHPRPLTSTLQSILTPAQVLFGQQSPSRPSYTPQALLVEPMYQPLAPSSSETISLAEYQVSPVPGQFVSQPQMLPISQSLTQSSSSSGVPVQSSYQPLVLTSYETVLQPGYQPSSVLVPSTSSQALSSPVVSNHESVFQSVQPELVSPLQVNYQSVTGQNAPGPAQNSRPSSQKLFRLLQQVKS
ncbi:mediator of RNA polymerase II transcription subunit 15-like [Danio aesculapii]|uniref:mediator of RNA polymerase II transcription subunit 15-like n=1 Tax=Danio aesculapii TaxID=1142201 RepID=UPI0024BFC341|nr:mediator of RNA polymerase II transcription subunit 15-like [Danio aesculapii]